MYTNKLKDLDFYSGHALKILTKKSELLTLQLNKHQKALNDIIKRQEAEGKPVRVIVLKARQLGISTFSTAFLFHRCATTRYKKATIIANDQDATSNLFNMCSRYYDYLPEAIKPMKRYSNRKELVFENPDEMTRYNYPGLLSRIQVETANKETAGRSGTITDLHISEVAFWSNAGTVMTSLLQSIPREPGTSVIIESTANGVTGPGEEFYKRWNAAVAGDSDYEPVFFPWHENSEYEMSDEFFEPNKDEASIVEAIPEITNRKLAWRRWKINNEMGSALLDPVTQFKQEYPSTPEEAFIVSGRTVFDTEMILAMIEASKHNMCKRYAL